MFCPRCKAEYRPGFVRCSDCDLELIDRLPEDSQPPSKLDDVELVVIRTYQTVVDAQLAKTALDSVGVDSFVRSDNEGGQAPFLSLTRGVQLLVRADDVNAAEDVLAVEGIAGDDREPPPSGPDDS